MQENLQETSAEGKFLLSYWEMTRLLKCSIKVRDASFCAENRLYVVSRASEDNSLPAAKTGRIIAISNNYKQSIAA